MVIGYVDDYRGYNVQWGQKLLVTFNIITIHDAVIAAIFATVMTMSWRWQTRQQKVLAAIPMCAHSQMHCHGHFAVVLVMTATVCGGDFTKCIPSHSCQYCEQHCPPHCA